MCPVSATLSAMHGDTSMERTFQNLGQLYRHGGLSRRDFIRSAATLGVAMAAVESFLAVTRPIPPVAEAAPAEGPTPEAAGVRGGTLRP